MWVWHLRRVLVRVPIVGPWIRRRWRPMFRVKRWEVLSISITPETGRAGIMFRIHDMEEL